MTPPVLTLYSRPGCHLCEQAADHLRALDMEFEVVDISSDAGLLQRYRDHIPVLALGEQELLRGVFSRSRLSRLMLLLREPPR